MTLPDERFRSIVETRKLLEQLAVPNDTIPHEITKHARWCLRHFPTHADLTAIEYAAPRLLSSKPIEDVTALFMRYELNQQKSSNT